jgi:hypothetical protein
MAAARWDAGQQLSDQGNGSTFMTPSDLDSHNRSVLVCCNGLGRTRPGPWLAMRKGTTGQFYTPTGMKAPKPAEWRDLTLDDIVKDYAKRGMVALGHLALVS